MFLIQTEYGFLYTGKSPRELSLQHQKCNSLSNLILVTRRLPAHLPLSSSALSKEERYWSQPWENCLWAWEKSLSYFSKWWPQQYVKFIVFHGGICFSFWSFLHFSLGLRERRCQLYRKVILGIRIDWDYSEGLRDIVYLWQQRSKEHS